MSTHPHIGKLCAAVTAVCLLMSLALMAASALVPRTESRTMGYESRLLDPSRVHTIAIVMEDWEGFLSTCEGEEYVPCDLVIDGEASRSVGIRD